MLNFLDQSICSIAKESLISIFETIDKSYNCSIERKAKHYIKAHLPRTILTVFGEITSTVMKNGFQLKIMVILTSKKYYRNTPIQSL